MAKLPGIERKRTGQFHARNLPRPDYMAESRGIHELSSALVALGSTVADLNADTQVSAATAGAANDLQEFRALLETSRSIPAGQIPEDIDFEFETQTYDETGEGEPIERDSIFTHEIADKWWATKSEDIVNNYASQISDPEARAKFVEDVMTKYVVPGTLAIAKASITKNRMHNQAMAEIRIQGILSSFAPTEEKEADAREVLEQQLELGADPQWVSNTLRSLGPRVDQIDWQNRFRAAETQEQVEELRNDMWRGDNRMTPDMLRTLDTEAEGAIKTMDAQEKLFRQEQANDLWVGIDRNQVTLPDVTAALEEDRITSIEHNKMKNALTEGSTTRFNDPFRLAAFRTKIAQLPYAGGQHTVSQRGRILKDRIMMASRGLTPTGQADSLPAAITGTEAAALMREVDTKVNATLKTKGYDRAISEMQLQLRVSPGAVDVTPILYGTEPAVRAYVAFKRALDSYMDDYGIDAKPVDFVQTNRATYDSENYVDSVNREFLDFTARVDPYMTKNADGTLTFDTAQQAQFRSEIVRRYNSGNISQAEFNEIAARFGAYYSGTGVPPLNQAQEIEIPDVLYGSQ